MAQQTFGRLSRAWTACEDHAAASDLIARYARAARRMVIWTESKFPGEDFEVLAQEGLYNAAYTWHAELNTPFLVWLKICVHHATSARRRTLSRREQILRRHPASVLDDTEW